jgi:cytoskeleton protein RodZ
MSNEITADFKPPTESVGDDYAASLGAWFARTRAQHGAEQRDVARHLMLNPSIIQAIENDDFARLGPPVFVRGYLSRYARLLDLPDQEVLECYRKQAGEVSEEPPPLQVVHPLRRQARARDLRGLLYLGLLVGVGWAAIQHLPDLDPGRLAVLWSDERPMEAEQTASHPVKTKTQVQYPFQFESVATARPDPASSSDPASPQSIASAQPATPLSSESTVETEETALESTSVVFTMPQESAPPAQPASLLSVSGMQTAVAAPASSLTTPPAQDSPASASASATVDGEAKLLLEFSNDCWVEVKDAEGNVLTSRLMRANTTHALSGAAPFKVTLGNAPAARIILDDRLVDTTVYVPRRGTVSRFTLDRD